MPHRRAPSPELPTHSAALAIERSVAEFYNSAGWAVGASGHNANLWEDRRDVASWYQASCRRRITRYLGPGMLVLDAGSGPVNYEDHQMALLRFDHVVCLDVSRVALAAGRRLHPSWNWICGSIRHLPFPSETFDCIMAFNVINHVEARSQASVVTELLRTVRPDGRVVILYFNRDRLLGRHCFGVRRGGSSSPHARLELYAHAHGQDWWNQFSDYADVRLRSARFAFITDLERLVPDSWIGRLALRCLFAMEMAFPKICAKYGAYYVVELRPRKPARRENSTRIHSTWVRKVGRNRL